MKFAFCKSLILKEMIFDEQNWARCERGSVLNMGRPRERKAGALRLRSR
jgi:hypothetical protein